MLNYIKDKKINTHVGIFAVLALSITIAFASTFIDFKQYWLSAAAVLAQPGDTTIIIRDESDNNYDGTGTNVTYVSGIQGEALYFDGNNSIVEVIDNNKIDPSDSFTVEAWVYSERPTGNSDSMRIISKDKTGVKGTFVLWEARNDEALSFITHAPGEDWKRASDVGYTPEQEWTHVAGVFDADIGKTKLFVNGSKVAEIDGSELLENSLEPITIGASADNEYNWIGRIDEVRIYERSLSETEINDSYRNLTVFDDNSLKLHYDFNIHSKDEAGGSQNLKVWALSDPHIHTDIEAATPRYSLTEALNDASGENGFEYDFGIIGGDIAGTQYCPSDRTDSEKEIFEQFKLANVNPNLFYSVIGNHGSNQDDASWFKRWIDPLGGNTKYSGINNNDPLRKDISGYWDQYSFEDGNVLFLMLGDHNYGEPPFGRDCSGKGGYPAGRYSSDQLEWWKTMIEENQDKIIVTVAHHALFDTTMNTGLCDGWANGSHGGHTWADRRGSSMIYAIDDTTIDGLTDEFVLQNPIETAEQCYAQEAHAVQNDGFKKYLEDNPGAIDVWMHGHTHWRTSPDYVDQEGRAAIEYKHGVSFINMGALTKHHGPPDVIYSRLLTFFDNSDFANVKTFLHEKWRRNGITDQEGFYDSAEVNIPLRHPYSK